jgi:hypothetical protein
MTIPPVKDLFLIFLKIFGMCCWAIWGAFTLAMTAVSMWQVLRGNAPFFQGAFYAGICGIGLGALLSYVPRRFMMRRECKKAAQEVLGNFKNAVQNTAKIREKMTAEFNLMVECLMDGEVEEAVLHQNNLKKLQENCDAIFSEYSSLLDKEKKDEPKASA